MRSDESGVLAAAEERSAALANRDPVELRRLMHPRMQWTTHGGAVLDRESYIAGNTGEALIWHGQRLEERSVTVVGDVAVLTAIVVDEVERNGKRETFRLRLTQTWVREGQAWRCIAGHAGPRLEAASEAAPLGSSRSR